MATELGQAYVQIIPSAKGIQDRITKELNPQATGAGKMLGGKIGLAAKASIAAAVAGAGALIAKSISEGAKLQQSIGGIETLFKTSSDKMMRYANEAYKTTGLSANAYMENVTSFSASLLQSVAGDTGKAADIANMAMIDMSDNANKMGTSMEAIQNAYQGFAKQNYTMLDNLKLGYGGTKAEMERLLADASKLTGVEYDISKLSDVYEAIHAVQKELGIAGTTALEAEKTFTGSFNAMKAAATDVFGKLAIGEDVSGSLRALADTSATFVFKNLIPMAGNIIKALPGAIASFVSAAVPQVIEAGKGLVKSLSDGAGISVPQLLKSGAETVKNFLIGIIEALPGLITAGKDLIVSLTNGAKGNMPEFLKIAGALIADLVVAIIKNLPAIIKAGIELIIALISGAIETLPQVLAMGLILIKELISGLASKFPEIIVMGGKIVGCLISGIGALIGALLKKAAEIPEGIFSTINGWTKKFFDAGKNIVEMIVKGILSKVGAAKEAMKNVAQSIREFLPFSPAKEGPLRDLDRLNFGGTIASSIASAQDPVTSAMNDLAAATAESYSVKKIIGAAPVSGGIAPNDEAARTGEGIVSGLAGVFQGALQPITIILQLPDGKSLAEVIFDPLTGVAKQKGVAALG